MSLAQLRKQAAEEPENGSRWLDLALALDARGKEAEAIPIYVRSLKLGMAPEERRTALLSMASSYRETSQLESALKTVETARREYRDDPAVESFYALILVDCGRGRQAVRVLGLALLREANSDAFGGFGPALTRKFRGVIQRR